MPLTRDEINRFNKKLDKLTSEKNNLYDRIIRLKKRYIKYMGGMCGLCDDKNCYDKPEGRPINSYIYICDKCNNSPEFIV